MKLVLKLIHPLASLLLLIMEGSLRGLIVILAFFLTLAAS